MEERTCLDHGFAAGLKSLGELDKIEKVAMLAGGGIHPLAGTLTRKPDKQALAARAMDIARNPVAALAMAGGQIGAADLFGLHRQAMRKVGSKTHWNEAWVAPGSAIGESGVMAAIGASLGLRPAAEMKIFALGIADRPMAGERVENLDGDDLSGCRAEFWQGALCALRNFRHAQDAQVLLGKRLCSGTRAKRKDR